MQRVQMDASSGNTPLFRINSLSDALGVEILGKAEVGYLIHVRLLSQSMNVPTGSSLTLAVA